MDHECEECGRVYAVREGCDPTRFCDNCAHDIAENSDKLQSQLEWLWKNCKIVYYPKPGGCWVEHDLSLGKDMRSGIEMEIKKT